MSQPGLSVRLMVSGSYVTSQELKLIVKKLQGEGLNPLYDHHYLCQGHSPKVRAKYWLEQLSDERIDYYWLVRGGEGTADLLPYLHQERAYLASLPKRQVLGMSDATALLVYLAQQYHWPSVYMANALTFAKEGGLDPEDRKLILKCLVCGVWPDYLPSLEPFNKSAQLGGQLEGSLCVGNLSIMNISIGDIWQFDARHKILLLEDWHEKGHAIWRTLKYFLRIGQLDGVRALVFGDFLHDTERVEQVNQIKRLLARFADLVDFPVYQTAAFGHGMNQFPLAFNQQVRYPRQE
jgi:muramoyltetrapeptide carboxypeptidase LdcA involved in peptidoglycan recycling